MLELQPTYIISLILTSIGIGTFSFFWIRKLSVSSTPVTGWLICRLRWFDFWVVTKLKKGFVSTALNKFVYLITECECCFAAQFSLWTGVFYFHFDWMYSLIFIGMSMFFAALTCKIINDL